MNITKIKIRSKAADSPCGMCEVLPAVTVLQIINIHISVPYQYTNPDDPGYTALSLSAAIFISTLYCSNVILLSSANACN